MKISIGEWKARDGRKAIVAAYNEHAHVSNRWVGWIGLGALSWAEDGSYSLSHSNDIADLIAPWVDPVPWDWSTTPPWINWIAMDASGAWYMYDKDPSLTEKAWSFIGKSCHRIPNSNDPQWSGDWKLSKTMRPGYNGGAK